MTYVLPITASEEWREDPKANGEIYFTDGEDHGPVCVIGHPDYDLSDVDKKRMAIILAAPDMLAELLRLRTLMRSAGQSTERTDAIILRANPQPKGCGL